MFDGFGFATVASTDSESSVVSTICSFTDTVMYVLVLYVCAVK